MNTNVACGAYGLWTMAYGMDLGKISAVESVWILGFVCSMIDEREAAKRFDNAMVIPIERILAGNR